MQQCGACDGLDQNSGRDRRFGPGSYARDAASTVWSTAAAVDQTVLHLSADGSVQEAPDQLVADLIARSTSPSAATAQRHGNARRTTTRRQSH